MEEVYVCVECAEDEYDDEGGDELTDLPSAGLGGMGLAPYGAGAGVGGKAGEKQVRRRSSKACDQCRKSKCKCERTNPQDPCRNCIMLGTRKCTLASPPVVSCGSSYFLPPPLAAPCARTRFLPAPLPWGRVAQGLRLRLCEGAALTVAARTPFVPVGLCLCR